MWIKSIKWYYLCALLPWLPLQAAAPADSLVILFTGNNSGQITDCGCGEDPAGGLLRLATAVDSLRRIYPSAILLDSGDWLTSYRNINQDRLVLHALQKISFDALAIGEYELPHSKPYLSPLFEELQLPLVLTDFPSVPHRHKQMILHRSGWNVRIVSFLEPALIQRRVNGPVAWHHESFIRAIQAAVRPAGQNPELLIAVFHQLNDLSPNILKLLPENSLIIRGHWHRQFDPETDGFRQVAGRYVVNPGDNGEFLGMAIFDLEKKHWSVYFIRLNRAVPEDPALAAWLKNRTSKLQE